MRNKRRRGPKRISFCFLATLLLLIVPIVNGAHSRRRPVVRRVSSEPKYDRSITKFSPDGRLQQVEYGMEAARRGDTVAALATEHCVAVAVESNKVVRRIDHHVLLITTGLVGDGRALASALRNSCQQFRLQYGEPATVAEVARLAAEMQHDLTRTAGARPLGCSAIVVGVDPVSGKPRLYQTEPGGIVEECEYCAAGKGRDDAMESLRNDYEKLRPNNIETDEQSENLITESVRAVAKAALGTEKKQDEKSTRSVEGWIVRAEPMRRGGVALTCCRNLEQQIVAALTIPIDAWETP